MQITSKSGRVFELPTDEEEVAINLAIASDLDTYELSDKKFSELRPERSLFCEVKMMSTTMTQFIVDEKGQRTAAILAIDVYEQLLEDLHDLRVVAQRRNDDTVSLSEMMERLNLSD